MAAFITSILPFRAVDLHAHRVVRNVGGRVSRTLVAVRVPMATRSEKNQKKIRKINLKNEQYEIPLSDRLRQLEES